MAYKLRDYQIKGKEMISSRFRAGDNKVMLWAMTGSGKGLWMADFVKEIIDKKMPVSSVMKRREIIYQTIENYKKYFNIFSSPVMGNEPGFNPNNTSQVCSIDTITRRIKNSKYRFLKDIPYHLIDECHDLTSIGYKRYIWFLENYPLEEFSEKNFESEKDNFKKFYIGFTATPFSVGRKTHTFWDSVVKPIEAHELMERGYLVPVKVFAPSKIDTKGIRINQNGDYDEKQLFERVSKLSVIGNCIQDYLKYGQNKPAICFCVNRRHAQIITKAFKKQGIPAIYCDGDHSKAERKKALDGLKNGIYKIAVNVGIWTTGMDAPYIEVFLDQAPTDSENLAIQRWGRILRPYKICICGNEYGGDPFCFKCNSDLTKYVKEKAIIIDNANNTARFGLPYDVRQAELELIDRQNKNNSFSYGVKTCPKCFAVITINSKDCAYCFHDFIANKQDEEIINVKGELSEVNKEFISNKTYQEIKQKYNTYKRLEIIYGWNPFKKYYHLYDDFNEDLFDHAAKFGITQSMIKKLQENRLYSGLDKLTKQLENKKDNQKVFYE